jgi:hypothetical protein
MAYTNTAILREKIGNPMEANVSEPYLATACQIGDGQAEAFTNKSAWLITDVFYYDMLGIAYDFAAAWARTGSEVEQAKTEDFDRAVRAAQALKERMVATGSATSTLIIEGSDDDNTEYFRCSPYGPSGSSNPQSYEAIHGFF